MTQNNFFIQVRNISKSYGQPGTERYQLVLDNLSFGIEKGESIAITGPSGSGKTTLLNLMGTLDKPDSGHIHVNGKDITLMNRTELNRFRNLSIGFVFQQHHLLPQFNLLENVLVPVLPHSDTKAHAQRAEDLLNRVGLWEHRHKYPDELSGGECQRTAVVRSLVNNPGIILADEPTGSLDQSNSLQLMDLLLKFNRDDHVTLVVVTHSSELALKLNKTCRLSDGTLELIRES